MGIQVNGNNVHWNYFIALEQDLGKVSRFIEFSEQNFDTYSVELAHLLLATCSEVDVVLKALCNMVKPDTAHKNIDHYKATISEKFPELIDEECYIPRYGLELKPWSNWKGEDNPFWWRSHNKVKHQRDAHFSEANLKNALNSMAGLSLVVLYYYREMFSKENAHTFREVTTRLQPVTTLLEFNKSYTYDNVVV